MLDTMKHIAGSKDDPADLINAAIEELIHQRYELPVYNTFKYSCNQVSIKFILKSYYLLIYTSFVLSNPPLNGGF